jgi:dienelactone hydrolase
MTDVLLLHHAQGLTSGVRAFAERLRAAGHQVTTPDLYDGHTFATLDEGLGYARQVGFQVLADRGVASAEALPAEIVYAGVSLGAMPAQLLAQTRPGALGALLLSAAIPPTEFGDRWPHGLPVQIHGMDHDEIFMTEGDVDAAREIVGSADDAELFLYPGSGHLFADESLPDHDPEAAAQLEERVLAFLARVGS